MQVLQGSKTDVTEVTIQSKQCPVIRKEILKKFVENTGQIINRHALNQEDIYMIKQNNRMHA